MYTFTIAMLFVTTLAAVLFVFTATALDAWDDHARLCPDEAELAFRHRMTDLHGDMLIHRVFIRPMYNS